MSRSAPLQNSTNSSGSKRSAEDGDDPKVAAAALLFHVMDADGERREEERTRLTQSLAAIIEHLIGIHRTTQQLGTDQSNDGKNKQCHENFDERKAQLRFGGRAMHQYWPRKPDI